MNSIHQYLLTTYVSCHFQVRELSRAGGANLHAVIRNTMAVLMTNALAAQYNLEGRRKAGLPTKMKLLEFGELLRAIYGEFQRAAN